MHVNSIPLIVPFNKSLYCFVSMHLTCASLSCCDLAMYALQTPSSHLVQGLPTAFLYTHLSHSTDLLSRAPRVRAASKPFNLLYHSSFVSLFLSPFRIFRRTFTLIKSRMSVSSMLMPQLSAPYITVGKNTLPDNCLFTRICGLV